MIAFALIAHSQITFQKTYGYGRAYSVQQINNGYVIAGTIYDTITISDNFYLVVTDFNGDTIWTKSFDSGFQDGGFSVQQTSSGEYIISGYSDTLNSFAGAVSLAKTDVNGNLLWFKTYPGFNNNSGLYCVSCVNQTSDGGYILGGSGYGMDMSLIKTDSSGNLTWSKTFSLVDHEQSGSFVQQTSDGGYIITGHSSYFGSGPPDLYLIKTDSAGNIIWSKTFGGANYDKGYSVLQTTDGGYIVCGESASFGSNAEVFLIKTNDIGNVLWSKTYHSVNSYSEGYSIQQTNDGGYIITGSIYFFGNYDHVYLIKTDINGDLLWSRAFGSGAWNDEGYSVQQTSDGGYIITGSEGATGSNYLIKTDSMGNSGCNQSNITTAVTAVSPQVTNQTPTVYTGGSITAPVIVIGSNGGVNTLCFNNTTGLSEMSLDANSISISPNPFSNSTTISFSLSQSQKVSLKIFDMNGRLVSTLKDKFFEAGENELVWSSAEVNAGIYFFQLQSAETLKTEKLVVTK